MRRKHYDSAALNAIRDRLVALPQLKLQQHAVDNGCALEATAADCDGFSIERDSAATVRNELEPQRPMIPTEATGAPIRIRRSFRKHSPFSGSLTFHLADQ